MIDEKKIMPFNFFKYGGVYSGEHYGMRYQIKRAGEKPDYELLGSVWQGPLAYGAAEGRQTQQTFSYDEQGRKKCIEWIAEQYETRKDEWDAAPALLDVEIDLDTIYNNGN